MDPIFENPFSGNCYAFPPVRFDLRQIKNLKVSAVFISHYHDDHCSLESLNLIDRKTPIYIHCVHEELFDLVRELGFETVEALKFNAQVKIGKFVVTPRQPLDPDVDSMLQISLGDLNILNVVDSMMDPDTLKKLQKESWDLVLFPFQAMRETAVLSPSRFPSEKIEIPEDWIEELRALKPRYVVPSSCQFIHEPWSWYNHALFSISYREFEDAASKALPETKVIRMNPSVSFKLSKAGLSPTEPLSWVLPEGEQNVDYEFRLGIKPPTTAEVAKRFAPLGAAKTERVLKYCRSELLKTYSALEETSYFSCPRIWQLSVFDHSGEATRFLYRIADGSIASVTDSNLEAEWTTEVPISKLYAALELGETLTSMYVRVNDTKFTPEIEAELLDMDVLEDPLIRSLFNGRFGAYQREQLKKIKLATTGDQF